MASVTRASSAAAAITAMTPMTTERTTTSTSFVDVTGATLTYTVLSGAHLYIGYSVEAKNTLDLAGSGVQILAGSTVVDAKSTAGVLFTVHQPFSPYGVYNGFALVPAAVVGTGSQTFKFRFRADLYGGTAYVKNCYLTIQSL